MDVFEILKFWVIFFLICASLFGAEGQKALWQLFILPFKAFLFPAWLAWKICAELHWQFWKKPRLVKALAEEERVARRIWGGAFKDPMRSRARREGFTAELGNTVFLNSLGFDKSGRRK